jgi:hypothetical protein
MRIPLLDVVIVVAWLVATMVGCAKVTLQQNENWVSYHSHALNYSFKHPPELRLIRRSVPEFRMEGLVEAVDLVSESDSVLRVMIFDPAGNPLAPVYDFKFLKEVCRNYVEFQIHESLSFWVSSEKKYRGFREGLLQVHIADLFARSAVSFACRLLGALDQPGIGDEVLDREKRLMSWIS